MHRDPKYDALEDQLYELTETFGKVLEMFMASLNANDDYLERPMPLPEQEQTQDLEDEKDMYDAQEYVEDEEESDQELPDCLPVSCGTLTKEYQDLIAKANRECCFEETRDHIEDAESDVEEETIHEPYSLTEYHQVHEDWSESERDQETSEDPQDFTASTTEDILEEFQEDILPPN